jgi:hypothetical protein
MCACAVRVCELTFLLHAHGACTLCRFERDFASRLQAGKGSRHHTTRHGTAQRWKIGRKEKADEVIKTKHWPLTFTTFIDCDRQTAMQIVNYDSLISSPLSACSLLRCVSIYVRRKNSSIKSNVVMWLHSLFTLQQRCFLQLFFICANNFCTAGVMHMQNRGVFCMYRRLLFIVYITLESYIMLF